MPKGLIICTLCQRVRRSKDWVDMGQVIRELRTFELDTVPQLHGVICDECVDSILHKRAEPGESLAA
jgi:hypothetical protein